MDALKLLIESDFTMSDYDIIKEEKEGQPIRLKVRGPYMMAEKENLNKRKYPYDELSKEVNRFNEEFIKSGRAWGELEHPDVSYIQCERVCHIITKLHEGDNKTFIGESVITASDAKHGIIGTPMGDIAASIIQYGGRFGMSSRGVGRLEEGTVHDYRLSTIDLVSDPSIGDFVDGILESKDFMINTHGQICEMSYDRFKEKLDVLPKTQIQEYLRTSLQEFLELITQKKK